MKILLVDDHTLFRNGMVHLLHSLDPVPLVLESASLQGAVDILDAESSIDLVLLDLSLQDSNGTESLVRLRQRDSIVPVVVLSGVDESEIIHQCIVAGAMGFVSKATTHDELLSAINVVIAGGVYLPRDAKRSFQRTGASTERSDEALLVSLSSRQREVLKYLIQGKPNKAISEKLNISQNTVKAHLSGIYRTLGAKNRTEAVYFAARARVPLE